MLLSLNPFVAALLIYSELQTDSMTSRCVLLGSSNSWHRGVLNQVPRRLPSRLSHMRFRACVLTMFLDRRGLCCCRPTCSRPCHHRRSSSPHHCLTHSPPPRRSAWRLADHDDDLAVNHHIERAQVIRSPKTSDTNEVIEVRRPALPRGSGSRAPRCDAAGEVQ